MTSLPPNQTPYSLGFKMLAVAQALLPVLFAAEIP
jgi:hypothetical protein